MMKKTNIQPKLVTGKQKPLKLTNQHHQAPSQGGMV